jgi:hypothetical protein
MHFLFQYLFKGTVKRQEINFVGPTATSINNFIQILFFSTFIPIVSIIGFFFFLFDYLITKASIYYFFKKSNDHGSAFLRECVRNLIVFLFMYPFFITFMMMRFKLYFLVPYFVFSMIWIFSFVFAFFAYWKYSRHQTFLNSEKYSENSRVIELSYQHPMMKFINFELKK